MEGEPAGRRREGRGLAAAGAEDRGGDKRLRRPSTELWSTGFELEMYTASPGSRRRPWRLWHRCQTVTRLGIGEARPPRVEEPEEAVAPASRTSQRLDLVAWGLPAP